ncbi:MAG TPA: class I SAM-dependent methyltransferase [Polyangiaceae bacterium]|nr:class I SAM-dependent methyltransferase [Polyangiaceae bacterium]
MSVFGSYSRYYDLLYRDKDYVSEAGYVRGLIQQYRPSAASLLDLGCGTGRHALLLAEMGYQVSGVDLSEEMLASANERLRQRAAEPTQSAWTPPQFVHGDIRSVRLGSQFDVVVSLFHVMSYQTRNEDLAAALATIREHLKPGGLFVFDCWYGPAVLSDKPQVRVRRLEDDAISVTRCAEPVIHANENVVDVNYHVFIRDKATQQMDELKETHRMRYLFAPEVQLLLDAAGLKLVKLREFMRDQEPSAETWNAVFVGTTA